MTERKLDLERRIELLQGEREGLSSTLDESADRIIMLEKQSREQESQVRGSETFEFKFRRKKTSKYVWKYEFFFKKNNVFLQLLYNFGK